MATGKLLLRYLLFVCSALWPLTAVVAQLNPELSNSDSTVEESKAELHQAGERLRSVVEAIKQCPPITFPGMDSDGGKTSDGPAMNLTWDVLPQSSVRAAFQSYIEFVKPYSWMPPPKEVICTKKKGHVAYCEHAWELAMQIYRRDEAHPHRYRYEFDYGERGLELVRTLQKIDPNDESQWADAAPSGCEGTALLKALKKPGEPVTQLQH